MAKSKFAGMFPADDTSEQAEPVAQGRIEHETTHKPMVHVVQAEVPKLMGRPPGKRSDPAFKQYSVLMRRDTQRAATNILRDRDDGTDFSGLVQELVAGWLEKQKT